MLVTHIRFFGRPDSVLFTWSTVIPVLVWWCTPVQAGADRHTMDVCCPDPCQRGESFPLWFTGVTKDWYAGVHRGTLSVLEESVPWAGDETLSVMFHTVQG